MRILTSEPPTAFRQALPELARSFWSRTRWRGTFISALVPFRVKVPKTIRSCRPLDILRFAEKPLTLIPKQTSKESTKNGKFGVMTKAKPKYIWRALGIFLAIVLLILIVGKPPWYTAKPISAVVVDFDTKKPVEDAVVVAIWILEKGTLAGSYITGVLEAKESISDKNGRFHIEGWGPKFPLSGSLHLRAPELVIFKPGYETRILHNEFKSQYPFAITRRSDWHDKSILLKHEDTLKKRFSNALFASSMVSILIERNNCLWKKTPSAFLVLIQEEENLRKAGLDTRRMLSKKRFKGTVSCGNPEDLLIGLQST